MSTLIAPFDDRLRPCSLWQSPRRALLIVLVVAMILPAMGTWLYFDVLAGSQIVQPVYSGAKAVQLALPLVAFLLIERRRVQWIGRRGSPRRDVIVGGIFGVVISIAMLILYYGWLKTSPLMASGPEMISAKVVDLGLTTPWKFLAFALFLSVLHSLLEEYYFRWFIFRRLQAFIPLWLAVVLSSLAFMGHHVIVLLTFFPHSSALAWFFSLCIAVGGGIWAWMYHRSGSLRGVWLSHFLIDCAIMWLGFEMIDWSKLSL